MNPATQVHFIGIGGYGMSAIARVLLEMGYRVTGSDMVQKELTDELARKGATVYIGHRKENVRGADLIVYSSDIPKDNVEMLAAREYQIPMIHRSDLLAQLLNERLGIAVAGSHGKTTTSSMISLVMERAGADPTYLIGGELIDVGSNARAGKGPYVVAEADESDGTFLKYRPYIAVITNIEPDHLENYGGDYAKLKEAFLQFAQQVKPGGKVVVCADDPDLRAFIPRITGEVITYGIEHPADYWASDIVLGNRKVSFTAHHRDRVLGQIHLSIPGRHNVYNALAAMIVCLEAGIPFERIAAELPYFHGAKRRFQVISECQDVLVVDDYAVHPTEIQATISAAKSTGRRIIAVFQPHRMTRAYYLLDAFGESFREADEVLVTKIYSPAGEKPIEGISAEKLVEKIREKSNSNVRYFSTKEEAAEYLKETVRKGDLVLTLGAGDVWKVARELARFLEKGID